MKEEDPVLNTTQKRKQGLPRKELDHNYQLHQESTDLEHYPTSKIFFVIFKDFFFNLLFQNSIIGHHLLFFKQSIL